MFEIKVKRNNFTYLLLLAASPKYACASFICSYVAVTSLSDIPACIRMFAGTISYISWDEGHDHTTHLNNGEPVVDNQKPS